MKLDSKNLMERAGISEDTQPIKIAGKTVDPASFVVGGIEKQHGADDGTADSYFEEASFEDGTALTDQQIDQLNDDHIEVAVDYAIENFHEL